MRELWNNERVRPGIIIVSAAIILSVIWLGWREYSAGNEMVKYWCWPFILLCIIFGISGSIPLYLRQRALKRPEQKELWNNRDVRFYSFGIVFSIGILLGVWFLWRDIPDSIIAIEIFWGPIFIGIILICLVGLIPILLGNRVRALLEQAEHLPLIGSVISDLRLLPRPRLNAHQKRAVARVLHGFGRVWCILAGIYMGIDLILGTMHIDAPWDEFWQFLATSYHPPNGILMLIIVMAPGALALWASKKLVEPSQPKPIIREQAELTITAPALTIKPTTRKRTRPKHKK
jgi:hypothetical protein